MNKYRLPMSGFLLLVMIFFAGVVQAQEVGSALGFQRSEMVTIPSNALKQGPRPFSCNGEIALQNPSSGYLADRILSQESEVLVVCIEGGQIVDQQPYTCGVEGGRTYFDMMVLDGRLNGLRCVRK